MNVAAIIHTPLAITHKHEQSHCPSWRVRKFGGKRGWWREGGKRGSEKSDVGLRVWVGGVWVVSVWMCVLVRECVFVCVCVCVRKCVFGCVCVWHHPFTTSLLTLCVCVCVTISRALNGRNKIYRLSPYFHFFSARLDGKTKLIHGNWIAVGNYIVSRANEFHL